MPRKIKYPIYIENYYLIIIPPKTHILKGTQRRISEFLEHYTEESFWGKFNEMEENGAIDPVQASYSDEAWEIIEDIIKEIKNNWSKGDGFAYALSTKSYPEEIAVELLKETVIGEFMRPIEECEVVVVDDLPKTKVIDSNGG